MRVSMVATDAVCNAQGITCVWWARNLNEETLQSKIPPRDFC